MNRLDYFETRPAGMDAYLSNYGYHFSKAMFEFAVKRMKDRNGEKLKPTEKSKVEEILKNNNIVLDNDIAYDAAYVYNMGKSDYYGSSIADESHLARFVKDYLDDKDGYNGIAFTRFYADCIATGTPILWEEMM